MKKILQSLLLLAGLMMLPAATHAQDIYGDVNSDQEVTIADVNVIIDVILGKGHTASADVNGDGEVTIADINAIINIILGGAPPPPLSMSMWTWACPAARCGQRATWEPTTLRTTATTSPGARPSPSRPMNGRATSGATAPSESSQNTATLTITERLTTRQNLILRTMPPM